MANKDDIAQSVERTWFRLEAESKMQAAAIDQARADGDDYALDTAVENYRAAERAKRQLLEDNQHWIASQNPQQPPQASKEERAARPWDKMNWDDALDVARTSRYAGNLRHDDPAVQAGYAEVQRRRRAGE